MSLPELSVQLYSVRQQLAEDFAGTIARLADIGLQRVEPYGLLGVADQLHETLPVNGLTCPTAHQALDGSDADLHVNLAAANELGVDVLVHPYSSAEGWDSRTYLQQLAATLGGAAALAREHGVRVAYHNHAWELSTRIDGRHALEVFAELLDPAVLLQVDAYWAATGGAHVPDLVRRLGDRVVSLHLKDGPLDGDVAAQLPLGSGDLPAVEVVAAAGALEYPVLEFDAYAGDIFDGIAASYAYATGVLGAQP